MRPEKRIFHNLNKEDYEKVYSPQLVKYSPIEIEKMKEIIIKASDVVSNEAETFLQEYRKMHEKLQNIPSDPNSDIDKDTYAELYKIERNFLDSKMLGGTIGKNIQDPNIMLEAYVLNHVSRFALRLGVFYPDEILKDQKMIYSLDKILDSLNKLADEIGNNLDYLASQMPVNGTIINRSFVDNTIKYTLENEKLIIDQLYVLAEYYTDNEIKKYIINNGFNTTEQAMSTYTMEAPSALVRYFLGAVSYFRFRDDILNSGFWKQGWYDKKIFEPKARALKAAKNVLEKVYYVGMEKKGLLFKKEEIKYINKRKLYLGLVYEYALIKSYAYALSAVEKKDINEKFNSLLYSDAYTILHFGMVVPSKWTPNKYNIVSHLIRVKGTLFSFEVTF